MKSKHWLWIVVVCMAIIAVHQIIKLTAGNAADSQSPETEPVFQSDQRTVHTASLADFPGMLEEKKQLVVELAKIEGPQEQDTVELAETTEAANIVETVAVLLLVGVASYVPWFAIASSSPPLDEWRYLVCGQFLQLS